MLEEPGGKKSGLDGEEREGAVVPDKEIAPLDFLGDRPLRLEEGPGCPLIQPPVCDHSSDLSFGLAGDHSGDVHFRISADLVEQGYGENQPFARRNFPWMCGDSFFVSEFRDQTPPLLFHGGVEYAFEEAAG